MLGKRVSLRGISSTQQWNDILAAIRHYNCHHHRRYNCYCCRHYKLRVPLSLTLTGSGFTVGDSPSAVFARKAFGTMAVKVVQHVEAASTVATGIGVAQVNVNLDIWRKRKRLQVSYLSRMTEIRLYSAYVPFFSCHISPLTESWSVP